MSRRWLRRSSKIYCVVLADKDAELMYCRWFADKCAISTRSACGEVRERVRRQAHAGICSRKEVVKSSIAAQATQIWVGCRDRDQFGPASRQAWLNHRECGFPVF